MTNHETELIDRAQNAFRDVLEDIPDANRRRALARLALQGLLQAELAALREDIDVAVNAMDHAALKLEDLRAGERVRTLYLLAKLPPAGEA